MERRGWGLSIALGWITIGAFEEDKRCVELHCSMLNE